ncbi:guanitoxin biosynthesis L-enduracididine beta-hydroxylase GntD [Rhizomonospora bruguierae]|uniref:guanitoxin biosynthesis L-enduracididine beta-hydroxylase GntD n=1 Tax=Rhizomonospora bruguierae TaxID=1581705 RepID=UPI001BCA7FAD|nr:guanitoxin biosynthesis L-enduracididine beta-hydroxylase GntD [Micromonospora sp. NBRC 107566]
MTPPHMNVVELDEGERSAATSLVAELAGRHGGVEDPAFQDSAETYAQELPRTLRARLNRFRTHESACICLVRNYPVDDATLGPTPRHWRERPSTPATVASDIFFFLCASLLGPPIAWSTKQGGHIMHTIAPIPGHETEQLASGSEASLTWHTEDAFHPLRADYLGLMCLRNPDRIETTFACVHDVDPEVRGNPVLFEPRFRIVPDGSHLTGTPEAPNVEIPAELRERARQQIARMLHEPEPIPLLFGEQASPYMRLDQHYTSTADCDRDAADALEALMASVDAGLKGFPLAPGDLCFIDNYKVVHGRSAFRARYDGTDRWLRRLNITRDLRKSRELRLAPGSRLVV